MDEDQYEIDEASGDSEEPICPAPAVDAAKHGRPTKTKIVNTAKPEVQKTRPKAKKDHFASLPDGPLHQNYDTLDLGHGEQPMKRLSPASEGKKILIEDTSPLAEKEELLNIPDEEPLQNEDPLPSGESEQPMEELAELTSPVSKSGKKTVDCQVHLDEGERMQLEALASDYIMLPDLRKLDENNVVMFAVDSLNDKTPPTPKPVVASPDAKFYGVDGYVDLPWDLHYVTEDGIQRGMIFWRELKLAAEQGFTCFNDFETLLLRLHTAKEALGLYDFFEYHSDDDEVLATLTLLHQIVKLALRAPELITAPIPLLITSPGAEHTSVTLSQEQCAALLACSFLGLIPYAEKQENHNEFNLSMFMMQRGDITYQKLCFVFNYFANVICHPPIGVVTFRRDMYPLAKTAFSDESMHKHMSKVAMTRNRIEECPRILQVDFANKYIGGGVMFSGFVQEEIRFLCCPELMVSMLLCPAMKQNEAITISGAQQYSNYEGYGHKTQFCPDVPDSQNQPRDKYKRIMCEVVAIDANEYPSQYIREQFEPKKVNREIRKAFAGFYTELDEKGPVVTGNWGCGAFHGHLQLKCIIQWIAASLAGRDVLYSTFSKEATISYFCDLVRKCRSKGILVGQIYKWLTNYDYSPNNSLFGYLEMRLDRQE